MSDNREHVARASNAPHLEFGRANDTPNQLRAAPRATKRRGAAVAAPDKRLWKK